MTWSKIDKEINRILCQNSPLELYTKIESLPDFVRNSRRFQKVMEEFKEKQYEENWSMKSNEEMVEYFTQIPSYIKETKSFKARLSQLTKSQKRACIINWLLVPVALF